MKIFSLKRQLVLLLIISLTFSFFTHRTSAQQSTGSTEISLISWNIRDFGRSKSDSIINAIADIVKKHDIVAIQEVVSGYGGSQAVAKLADALNRKGNKWDYAISYPTKSPPYKTEKYAYLWKTSKVKLLKKARLLSEVNPLVFREPYLISFQIDDKKISLLNYHSRKHNDHPEEEIKEIVTYLNTHNQTILLGDFNLKQNHPVWNPLYAIQYTTALHNISTTLKRKCNSQGYMYHAIDNIFYNTQNIHQITSGKIDFVKNCDHLKKARYISDHLPIFMKFTLK